MNPISVQRVENAAVAVAVFIAFVAFDLGWWWLLVLFLAFDLSAVGYLSGPRRGAILYNVVHNYSAPALLSIAWLGFEVADLDEQWIGVVAGSWAFHVAADRALGYGLKHPDGFEHTHLGPIGRLRRYRAPMPGTAKGRTDTASRVIAAPPAHVYTALVDSDALAAWLPPDGTSGKFERFDARPGGSYRFILTYADASTAPGKATADSDIVEGRFVELVPGVRVVQAVDFLSDDPAYAGTMTMTWEVDAADAGTRVTVRADDVPTGISAEDHAAGLASSLRNLAAYVER